MKQGKKDPGHALIRLGPFHARAALACAPEAFISCNMQQKAANVTMMWRRAIARAL
jgi:hypothetical protein